jgi:hypothetical protein
MRAHAFAVVVLVAGGVLAPGAGAHTFQRGTEAAPTGLLMGVVVDAGDQRPVPNAEVTLGGALRTVPNTRVLTDADGRFVFMDLPAGTYTLTATKLGYADGALGRRRPLGPTQSVTLGDAERVAGLEIPLWRFAVITGRVVDEAGEPLVGIAVQVLARSVVAGRLRFVPGTVGRTDDRGIYRIASLTPGDYVVAVPSTQSSAPQSVVDLYRERMGPTPPSNPSLSREASFSGASDALFQFERGNSVVVGTTAFIPIGGRSRMVMASIPTDGRRMHVYPTQYHPSAATAADAAVVTLRSGDERSGLDVPLTLVPASRVSGVVTGPDGPLIAALSLVPDSDDLSTEAGFEVATTLSDTTGRFTFLGVPEGRHRLRALWVQVPASGGGSRGAPPPRPTQRGATPLPPRPALGGFTLWSTQMIEVGEGDVDNLAVTLSPGFRIGGHAEFVGSEEQPWPEDLRRMSATFDPADARPLVSAVVGRGQFDDEGYLSSYQLPPGRYYVRVNNVPVGWAFKSATLNGRDISNVPVMLDRDVTNLLVSFTDHPSSLSGQVHGATGVPDPTATVLIFPSETTAWLDYGSYPRRLRAVRVGREGHYDTSGLPPGEYLVVAVADEAAVNWQDPPALKSLARVATLVKLAEGESRSLLLRTSAVPR